MDRRISLFERRKYPPQRLRRNPNSAIAYFNDLFAALVAGDDQNPAAYWCKLQRISDEIRHNLFKLARISPNMVTLSFQLKVDPDLRQFLPALQILERQANHLVRVDPLKLQPQSSLRHVG